MKIQVNKILYQIYVLPTIKITHNICLNGSYEFIICWFKYELAIYSKSKIK